MWPQPALGAVDGGVALEDPAVVAGLGLAERQLALARRVAHDRPDVPHRLDEAALLGVGVVREQAPELGARAPVEGAEDRPARSGEPGDLPAAVGLGALADHQAVALEAGEDAAHVAGVELEVAAQRR